jgi:uncharacterized protein
MRRMTVCCLAAFFLFCSAGLRAQMVEIDPDGSEQPSGLTVFGRGFVEAAPDEASVRLGAVAQAEKASAAQEKSNLIVQGILNAITSLGIPEKRLTTVELSIVPIYANERFISPGKPVEPVIVAYEANNVIRVQVEDLGKLGQVIDAGLAAGANRLEGVSFGLKDDTEQRKEALRLAARESRSKAEVIAKAMGVRLAGIREIAEGGVNIIRPQMEFRQALAADSRATPVQPGQIRVEASLTVSFFIMEIESPAADEKVVISTMSPPRSTTP